METASKEVTRDFPTPPLPLATAMILRTELISWGASKKSFRLFVLEGQFSPQVLQSWVQFSGTSREAHSSPPVSYTHLTGIHVISANMLLEEETAPVIWRGPMIAGVVKQFWTDVIWNDIDFLFVDMPPGTGDVPITVFQSIPVDGVVAVSYTHLPWAPCARKESITSRK